MTHDNQLRFPADNAFVVQFAQLNAPAEPRPGRVEHIASGRARRFQDATQLMAFVAEVLTALDGTPAAKTDETQS